MDWNKKVEELLIELNENASVEVYWQLTQAYRNKSDLYNAEAIARKGLNVFPTNPVLVSEWAWNAQVKKDYMEASKRLEQLIKILEPNVSEKIYARLLDSYRNSGQFDKIETLIQEALKKYPNSVKIKAFLEKDKEENLPKDVEIIVLTTFPKHASNNVGDQLITYSLLKLLKKRLPNLKYHIEFRAANLDRYLGTSVKYILAPGFSVSNGVYPNIYGLYTDLENLPVFLPIGCSFQHIVPSCEIFEENVYSDDDKKVLKLISKKMKYPFFLCRDELIKKMLLKNDIRAIYSGDLAVYDECYLNKPFIPPKKIKSIVFTIGHHDKYEYQSYCLLALIRNAFPRAKLYVSYHSKINPKSEKIGLFAKSLGFDELYMFGDVEKLTFYDNIDLHVGYRLHGHISFLRRRKPSVLLVEDARSYGFAKTKGSQVGCFEALISDSVNNLAPCLVMKFLELEIKNEFKSYCEVFELIDNTFNNVISPIIDELSFILK